MLTRRRGFCCGKQDSETDGFAAREQSAQLKKMYRLVHDSFIFLLSFGNYFELLVLGYNPQPHLFTMSPFYVCWYPRLLWLLTLSSSMWGDKFLSFVGAVRDLSSGLSCPYHCGSSTLPVFGFGFCLGLLCGLICVAYLYLAFFAVHLHQVPVIPTPFSAEPTGPRRRSGRLSGYLHE